MTKVLVLGGSGMLGHKMFQILGEKFPETYATVRTGKSADLLRGIDLFDDQRVLENVDVLNLEAVNQIVTDLSIDVVINCVGIIKQRDQASDVVASIQTNSLLPHQLAEICERASARFVHFSTDCVFDGASGSYDEDAVSNATDIYGRTKYLGESGTGSGLTLRSSIIGRELSNFDSLLEWFLAQNHGTIRGFTRAMYSGLTTNCMSRLVGDLIENHQTLSGIYQVSGPWISKYDLLLIVREKFNLDIEIVPDDTVAIDRTMKAERFEQDTGFTPPSWEQMIEEIVSDKTIYKRTTK